MLEEKVKTIAERAGWDSTTNISPEDYLNEIIDNSHKHTTFLIITYVVTAITGFGVGFILS